MGPSSTVPSVHWSYMLSEYPICGCMGPSVGTGLTTVGMQLGRAAPAWLAVRQCLVQWLLDHWRVRLGPHVSGCSTQGDAGWVGR